MALLPLLWLGVLAYYGQRRSPLCWALALVFTVSWIADTAAHWLNPWTVSAVYPLVQVLLLAVVVLPAVPLFRLLGILAGTVGIVLWTGVAHRDIVLRTVAWTALLVVAWPHRPLWVPVLVTFGMGWLAWVAYTISPTWVTWGSYQGIRALGLGSFCWVTAPTRVRI
jgi:hypothetical protein